MSRLAALLVCADLNPSLYGLTLRSNPGTRHVR